MFKLMAFLALVAMATAKPGALYASPIVASGVINEQTVESHGNAVVHASAPVISAVPAIPVAPLEAAPIVYEAAYQPAHLIGEKSVSSYGHSVVHHQPAVAHSVYVAPAHYL